MADANSAQAINQVKCIVGMCDFFDNPSIRRAIDQSVPVSMPPEAGALGFDIPLWVGLGMVGLWAALDAHAERAGLQSKCSTCGRKCIVAAYTTKLQGAECQAFAELEDLRHLYAHNYAGEADDEYFKRRRHIILKRGVRVQLSCGAIFDGWRLCRKDDSARPDLTRSNPPYTVNSPRLSPQYALNLSDLRKYSHTVQSVLGRFP
jgi:hypothetical protein